MTRLLPADSEGKTAARSTSAWNLVLPAVRSILCQSAHVPRPLLELARRGVAVDLVASGEFQNLLCRAAEVGAGRVRVLPEPDRDRRYELALLWDPASGADVDAWLRRLATLTHEPAEIAVWSRNPWNRHVRAVRTAPHWLAVDHALRRAGWRPALAQLGLPGADRVRQIVGWSHYARTPLVQHRRSHRFWKAWIVRQPAYRWLLPARLLRATRSGKEFSQTVLDRILEAASHACGHRVRCSRLLVSPNGVAIVRVHIERPPNGANAILKVPLTAGAEPRVAANAAALQWMVSRTHELGPWARVAPGLLGRGDVGGWSYTLEECVEGSEAQGWCGKDAERAMSHMAAFLETLARLGDPARPLDAQGLESLYGAHVRRTVALLEPMLAQRLQEIWGQVVQALEGVRVPRLPRPGDLTLENVLGAPARPDRLRLLDWELWTPCGLPLLDVLHLIASRRRREIGVSMGGSVRRWLLTG
ncbi:MAG: hypothetical protein ACE5G2_08805, partial [Candidatus Krumholzibacteriia bacterium]